MVVIKSCVSCSRCRDCNEDKEYCSGSGFVYWEPRDTPIGIGTTEEANHYMTSKQPIEIMQELMTAEQFQGFLWGNVIKYSMRLGRKGKAREDAGKCWQYAKWMVDHMDGKMIIPGGK